MIPFGEGHLRRTIAEYVAHYNRERNHQGIENTDRWRGSDQHRRPDSLASAARRRTQLLRARCVNNRSGRALGQYGRILFCGSA